MNAEPSKVPEDISEVCGQTSAVASVRIVGGTQATPGAWPWAAALGRLVDGRFREGSAAKVGYCGSDTHSGISIVMPKVL